MARGGGIGRLLRQLQVEDWLGPMMDDFFAHKEPERWVQPDATIHPSGAGHICALNVELGLLGHRAEVKSRNRRRMDNGQDAHERWQRYFREKGILVASEWPVKSDDPSLSGRIDLILQNPFTGALAAGEIKTTNTRKFSQLPTATGDRAVNARGLYSWHRDWFVQFTWYCTYGNYNGRAFDEKFFLVENTDNQDYKIIWVDPQPEHVAECSKGREAQNAAREGRLLDRPYEKGDKVCQICDRAQLCDMLADGEAEAWAIIQDQLRKLRGPGTAPPPVGPGAPL